MTRRIAPLQVPDIARAPVAAAPPRFVDADPRDLWIDERYQRDLSPRSVRLILRMVAHWDWARFRAPVAAQVEGALHLIDGQHTAIAAATHGGLGKIPVGIVEAASLSDRSQAFVGLNRDRIQVTASEVHFAEIAAGDAEALTVAQVCARAGATLLRSPPSHGRYRVGETIAINTVRKLVAGLGAMRARAAIETLVKARCAPLTADLMRAAAELLYAPEHSGQFTQDDLATAIRAFGDVVPAAARDLAERRRIPLWRALVIHLGSMEARNGRRSAA